MKRVGHAFPPHGPQSCRQHRQLHTCVPAHVQAKAAADIPSWLYQRLSEESAALAQAANAPFGGQKHGHQSRCCCELLVLRGSAEAELAWAAQHADPGDSSMDVDLLLVTYESQGCMLQMSMVGTPAWSVLGLQPEDNPAFNSKAHP